MKSMIQGTYSIIHTGTQDSEGPMRAQREIIVFVCRTSASGQREENPSSDVSERATEYLRLHHAPTSHQETSLQSFEADTESFSADTVLVAYVFDRPAESLFKFFQAPPSDAGFKDGFAVSKFLNSSIWKHVADILAKNPDVTITLSSGPACMPLEEFKTAIERLVEEGEVRVSVSAMGDMERSIFWRNLIKTEASSRPGEEYTFASGSFDLDLCQLTPRTAGRTDGSETSDSAEEGAHGNN